MMTTVNLVKNGNVTYLHRSRPAHRRAFLTFGIITLALIIATVVYAWQVNTHTVTTATTYTLTFNKANPYLNVPLYLITILATAAVILGIRRDPRKHKILTAAITLPVTFLLLLIVGTMDTTLINYTASSTWMDAQHITNISQSNPLNPTQTLTATQNGNPVNLNIDGQNPDKITYTITPASHLTEQ